MNPVENARGNNRSKSASPKRPVSSLGNLFAAFFCVGAGLFILAISAGIIHVDPSTVHAPYWIVGACGIVFVFGGLILLARHYSWARGVQTVLGPAIFILLATVLNWIAFGPGERQFSGTISLPFSAYSSRASELTGRIVFGIFAVILDVLIVYILIMALRRIMRR